VQPSTNISRFTQTGGFGFGRAPSELLQGCSRTNGDSSRPNCGGLLTARNVHPCKPWAGVYLCRAHPAIPTAETESHRCCPLISRHRVEEGQREDGYSEMPDRQGAIDRRGHTTKIRNGQTWHTGRQPPGPISWRVGIGFLDFRLAIGTPTARRRFVG